MAGRKINQLYETKKETPRIAIVDDSYESQVLYKRVLRSFDVTCYDSGQEFLQKSRDTKPDVLVLDVNLPGMSGYEVCRKVRNEKHQELYLGVVMVSDTMDPFVTKKGLAIGADDFVRKSAALLELRPRVNSVLRLKNMTDELKQSQVETVLSFVKVAETNDADTGGHIERMGYYSALLYDKCGFDKESCERIRLAAMLHDIGKVCTPDKILKKPGGLTDEEWIIMKLHASHGYEILFEAQSPLLKMGAAIARSHHEKWDGSGYPLGLRGDEIPLEGRIVAIADVFDALLSKRCYKDVWPLERVLETINTGRGKHFDPFLVDLFFEYIEDLLEVRRKVEEHQEEKKNRLANTFRILQQANGTTG